MTRMTKEQIKRVWMAQKENPFAIPAREDSESDHQWMARVRAEGVVYARALDLPEDVVGAVANQLVEVAVLAERDEA